MKRLFVLFFVIFSINTYAADLQQLQPADSKLIEATGIPLYVKATFTNGAKASGFRFATRLPPEKVQAWYRQQLPNWELYDKYGGWILYDGAPARGMADVLPRNWVSVKFNEFLPEWFSVDKDMTTEIVIMVAK